MTKKNVWPIMLTLLFSVSASLAQTSAPPSGSSPSGRQTPCWRQAGLSRSQMEQHQSIQRDAHAQVASVCENSSLTPQQKQQQVREIREQAQQKMDALLTAEQRTALHSCQHQHGTDGAQNGMHHSGAGPCGNFASQQGRQGQAGGSTPQQSEDSPHR